MRRILVAMSATAVVLIYLFTWSLLRVASDADDAMEYL